mgnify:CR=1 FL=1
MYEEDRRFRGTTANYEAADVTAEARGDVNYDDIDDRLKNTLLRATFKTLERKYAKKTPTLVLR